MIVFPRSGVQAHASHVAGHDASTVACPVNDRFYRNGVPASIETSCPRGWDRRPDT
jgi:hypothetical protein